MSTIVERLMKFMDLKNLNDNELTVKAKLSIGLIGKAKKSSRRGLYSDTIEKILKAFPEINPVWFISGEGDMFKQEYIESSTNPVKQQDLENAKCQIILTQKMAIESLERENKLLRKMISKDYTISKDYITP